MGRLTLQDQAQIGAENKAGDRPRAAAAPSQRIRTSGIPEAIRIMIARKREEAIKKKKDREEGEPVEHESHKKQKSKQSENLKKRHIEDVEDAEHENSSKRGKSAGQNGCKQLGCSTHKGIS